MTSEGEVIKPMNKENYRYLLESSTHVIVDFSANWCPPCAVVKTALEELAPEYPQILFCTVDIDQNPDLSDQYEIDVVPTIVFIENGIIQNRSYGFWSFEKLTNDVKRLLDQTPDDLSHIFADGEIWEVDEDDLLEILKEVSRVVLLFSGTDYDDYSSMRRKLKNLAREFSGLVFFGMLDSEESVSIRSELRIPKKQTVTILIKDGEVLHRFLGRQTSKTIRTHIQNELQTPQRKRVDA